MISHNDNTGTAVRLKIPNHRLENELRKTSKRLLTISTQQPSNSLNCRCRARESVIRLRARRSWRAFERIKPTHGRVGIAPLREIADVARIAGESRVQKIGIK